MKQPQSKKQLEEGMNFLNLFKSLEKEGGWMKFQIDSFDNFVENSLQSIINEIGTIDLMPDVGDVKLSFGKVEVGSPYLIEADGYKRSKDTKSPLFPNECRIRNLTYSAPVWVNITPIVNGVQEKTERVHIGDLPVMVGSRLCSTHGVTKKELIAAGEDPDDVKGYFIVNGTERTLVLIEEIAGNKPVFEKDDDAVTVRVNSERSGFKQRHLIERRPEGNLTISFANIRRLSIVTLLKSLGMSTDKDICDNVSGNPKILNELYISLYESEPTDEDEAIDVIGKKLKVSEDYRTERVNQILDRYLLPHIGQEKSDRMAKAMYLSRIISKVIAVSLYMIPQDDIDHYANKRLLTAGELLSQLFRSVLLGRWGLIAKMTYNYQKLTKRGQQPSVQGIVDANAVTKQILSSLATGNWIGGRTGVSQRLDRSCYIKTVSHLRSVVSPLTTTQEHFSAREIHPTEWGRLCPAETPEGSSIGLRKHLALLSEITPGMSRAANEVIVKSVKAEIEKAAQRETPKPYDIYYNGDFMGKTAAPKKVTDNIRKKRRAGLIHEQLNIVNYGEFGEIRINTDTGRCRRPLLIVENGKTKLSDDIMKKLGKDEIDTSYLVKHGIIEYLDAEEEENSYVVLKSDNLTPQHTHLEVTPLALLGLPATLIPYPGYNRGDRINYGAKMVGQSIGIPIMNYLVRTDTKFNTLLYPQSPIIDTATSKILRDYPSGQNVVLAVMCWDGYNLNDAIVMNKSSVERGMLRSIYYRTYETEKKRYWGGQEDEVAIPEPGIKGHRGEDAYRDLADDGIINPETPVISDSVLVGKSSPLRFLSGEEFAAGVENQRETSITVRHGEGGIADKVLISESTNGNHIIKVRVRERRIPELGDKFASRHGQKGVVSLMIPHEDMPFTADGVVPDILFNPHGVPSRMTMGQLLETLAGKTRAMTGKHLKGTAFDHLKETEIRKLLVSAGFRDDGKEILYDGRTGKAYEVMIFTGMSFYLKLDHMVANKLHARSRGPVTLLTRQPTEGRAKRGGLRLGEMEQQCLVAHGSALTLKERFDSDKAMIPVCQGCGLVAIYDKANNRTTCQFCKDSKIRWVETSYAFKLFIDEAKSMGIYPNLEVGDA
ncbi:MAG: DNA-directed RNA polymerase subunit B [Candidatus Aenigmatarchaeota archaeon]|nr:MAG: DNA-directed RNA polymerase subunit B [Candidatus Aenigmarchaeota archaeon]